MKRFVVGLLGILASSVVFGQGIQLDQGQSYTFEFNSVPLVPTPTSEPVRSHVIAWFEPTTYQYTHVALLEAFADSLADTPLTNSIGFDDYTGRWGVEYAWRIVGPNPDSPYFPDLQGVLRVTMLDGSAQLSGFEVAQYIDGNYYVGYFPIPEPNVSSLFAPILVSLFFVKKKSRSKAAL